MLVCDDVVSHLEAIAFCRNVVGTFATMNFVDFPNAWFFSAIVLRARHSKGARTLYT